MSKQFDLKTFHLCNMDLAYKNSLQHCGHLKVSCVCACRISPYLHERFASAFDAQSVRLVSVKGNHFVLVNSMAMEGDGCFLCRPAELQLQKISSKFPTIINVEPVELWTVMDCTTGGRSFLTILVFFFAPH